MDERARNLIISGVVFFLILLLVVGTIFYLFRFISSRGGSPSPSVRRVTFPQASSSVPPIQVGSGVASPQPQGGSAVPAGAKTYKGGGFEIPYPRGWGLLTCANSQNFEFDPLVGTDQLNVNCDFAVKPITVLVGGSCARGEAMNIGNILVLKSKKESQDGVRYEWCSKTNPVLDITHRVSSSGSRATSSQDYSSQIEEMIKNLRLGAGS